MSTPSHHAEGFHARIHPSEPLTDKGHKPGIKVGKDKVPEFHAETHPAGTAPPESTYQPNPSLENEPALSATTFSYPAEDQSSEGVPGAGAGAGAGAAAALDMPGVTSQDVYKGMGKPLQGMEGREVSSQMPGKKHTGERTHPGGRKREKAGLAGLAPSAGADPVRQHGWDLPEGVEKGMKGKATEGYPGAEDRVPEGAETVATEAPKGLSDEQ